MKPARKTKFLLVLFLLWALPVSMLPRVTAVKAKPLATAVPPANASRATDTQLN